MKAGILEAGEIFVINKADRDGYDATHRQFELMLHLREQARPGDEWHVPLLRAVASQGEGGEAIVDTIEGHRAYLDTNGGFALQSGRREREQVLALLRQRLARRVLACADDSLLDDVAARRLDPYSAVERLTEGLDMRG